MSEVPVHPIDDSPVDVRLSREEAAALLLAVDALAPLLERIRAEVAPPDPNTEPTAEEVTLPPDTDDALRRATWLARESLREARSAIGQRRPTAEQRRAWQESARRYLNDRRRAVLGGRERSGAG
jgi:hypothetical protein